MQKTSAEAVSKLECNSVIMANAAKSFIITDETGSKHKIEKLNSNINEIYFQQKITPRLSSMKDSCANVVEDLEENSSTRKTAQQVTQISEHDSKENRDKKLILFGVRETDTKQETVDTVQAIFKDCHISYT